MEEQQQEEQARLAREREHEETREPQELGPAHSAILSLVGEQLSM